MRAVDATFNALLVPENGASGVCTLPGRYSKLSPPRLLEPLIRSSLFERLDAHVKARSIIWISAPAGAGKSTLVASFLAHAKIPAIWYAVDAGDNDPASFMAFLNKAVRTECNNANSTSAIIQADPAAHFFHQFYARFPAGSTLIFEDVQNLDWNLAGNILECAISAAPPEVSLFLVSRESCPPHLDEEVVGRPVVRIGWRELRLNERESLLVAGKTSGEEIKHCRNWLALTGGWAAGIVMLRGQLFAGNRNVDAPISPDDLDMAFHYFAHEVLALLSKEEQFALFMLSHMPDWSIEEACEVTGERSTAALVERLFKCGTFVDCATPESGDVHCMHFHPMFQMFLEHESKRELPSSVRRALISRVAGVFLRRGQIPEAASRYRDSQDWNALAALLLRDARQMIAEGRGESWRQWQSWLPEQAKDAHPWLFYWEGQYLNLVNARQARVAILRAEAAFAARGDHRASLLSIALMVDNIIPCFSVADRAPLQRWADAMGTRMVALPAGG
jgi:LuxR family maltose regulon positive regulatory protein